MLPVIASVNTFNFQTPLVNTATPGSGVVHVPYDNVAPSVSDEQVNNNATPNNTVVSSNSQDQATAESPVTIATPAPDNSSSFSTLLQNNASNASSGVQATFVAQLAAQDNSPQTQVILVQYEQLVANGYVKYKPSDAAKPQDEPSGAFGRILQSDKAPAPAVQQAVPAPPAPATTNSTQAAIVLTASLPTAAATPAPRKSSSPQGSDSDTLSTTETTDSAPASGDTAIPPHVIDAYASTATRVDSFSTPSTELA